MLGNRLKELRKKKGLSQEAFGAIGEVTKQAQLRYEKGERYPTADYLANLAKIGVDVQYIITGEPSTSQLNPDEITLLQAFRQADITLKAAAIAVLTGNRENFTNNGKSITNHGNYAEGDIHLKNHD